MNSRRNLFFRGLLSLFIVFFCSQLAFCDYSNDLFSFDYTTTPSASRICCNRSVASECVMTVFIHGTVGPKPAIGVVARWFKNMLQGKRSGNGISAYQEYIEQVKRNGIHRWQPINSLGLVKINLDKNLPRKDFGYIGQKTAQFYKKLLDPSEECVFYTFSWSGRLSHKHRVGAARDLYRAILKEKEKLSREFCAPIRVNLIAHSHGCNVVLNLDRIEKELKKNLVIDRVVFFGGPIQSETEGCVNSKIFKKIYHLFSCGDHMQRLDFVSTQDRASRRTFGSDKNNPVSLPKNLCQIEVELGECHPFHYELWLWGRKSFPYLWYRRRVPLHPMPLSVFTPEIVSVADSVNWDSLDNRTCKLKFDEKGSRFVMCDGEKSVFKHVNLQIMKQQAYNVL